MQKPITRSEKKPQQPSSAAKAHVEDLLDEALKETFPASDPVAIDVGHRGATALAPFQSWRLWSQGLI
jgi:hypothetical protein